MKTPSSALPLFCFTVGALALVSACSDDAGSGAPFGTGGSGNQAGAWGIAFAGSQGVPAGRAGQGGSGLFGKGGSSSGAAGEPQAGGSTSGQGGNPATAVRALCDAYVACIANANPGALGPIADAYGKQGNCFDQGDEALCEKACKTGLVQAHQGFPKVAACNYCDSAKDCGAGAPACDPQTHTCKACSSDAHCTSDALPACDVATFTCVACNANGDCDANSNRPICDVASHTCAPCQSDDDCAPQASSGRGICGTSGKCRGCASDGECGEGRCDVSQQRCVGCLSDDDCSDGGVCDSFTRTCCGAGLCASKGYVCGSVTAGGCGGIFGTSVDCGTCGEGTHCDDNQCVEAPPAGCPTACAKGERCGYDRITNTRLCVPKVVDCKESYLACGPGYRCDSEQSKTPPYESYRYCTALCLADADCPATVSTPGWTTEYSCEAAAGEVGTCVAKTTYN